MLLEFAEWSFVVGVLFFYMTQVFFPIWRGTPLFPMLKRESRLMDKLASAKQDSVEKNIEKQIEKEKGRG